jgi:arylsulfatase A
MNSHSMRSLVCNWLLSKLLLCTSLLCGLSCWIASARTWGADKPNVVIILVDDMGYGDPACFNPASKIRTPHINSLATEGMRFTDAHAPGPLCHMSRYGLMTGRYPFRTDVTRWPKHALIEPEQTTLASLLKAQGYHTAMVGKWHLGFEEQGYDQRLPGGPTSVGFDSFFGIRASTDIPPYFYIRDNRAVAPPTRAIADNNSPGWSPIQGAFWRAGLIAEGMELIDVLPRFTDEAIAVIDQHAAGRQTKTDAQPPSPLFLYLAYPAPHTPWLPTSEFAGQSQVGLYGDFAEMVDAMVGRVLAALQQAGMAEDTLLIFTSDNGPTWYDSDVTRFQHDSAGGLRGMKADAWEAGHRMPFIVRWPGHIEKNSTSSQLICFTDILATLAAVTGYELGADQGPDSFDFSHVWQGAADNQSTLRRTSWAMHSGSGFKVVRDGDWKLINGLGSGGFSEPKRVQPQPGEIGVQLYNLKSDLVEANNVAAQNPEIVQRLSQLLLTLEGSK